jgi:hypothetical protein
VHRFILTARAPSEALLSLPITVEVSPKMHSLVSSGYEAASCTSDIGKSLELCLLSSIAERDASRGRWAKRQTPEAIEQKLAERVCWPAARRDDARLAPAL